MPKKRKKNQSLEFLRSVTRSLAHGLVPDEEIADKVDEGLARIGGGLASQYYGIDEEGNLVDAFTSNLKRLWNMDERRKEGLPPEKRVLPGLITDTLSLPNILGNGPEWSQRMMEEADATHTAIGEDLDLPEASGFVDHALDAGGMMLGQVPLWLASAPKRAQEGIGALQKMKNFGKAAAVSPVEFFMPTIEPRTLNYLMGSGFGGALGALGDEIPGEVIEEPRVHKAKGGKVGTFNRVLDAIRSRYPKPGVFSVLDNLIEQAPFERATPDQWKAYLKPGREYVREDVRFPLRKDELRWGGEQFDVLMNSVRHDNPSVTKEELLEALRKGRPEFSSVTYGGAQGDAKRELRKGLANQLGIDYPDNNWANAELWDKIHDFTSEIYDAPRPRFGNPSWRSPGGDNYHEWVTGIPTRDIHTPDYDGGHFPTNTVSWSRIQDIPAGPPEYNNLEDLTEIIPRREPKVRLIDELQSDLHQAATFKMPGEGGRLGYASDSSKALTEDEIREILIPDLEQKAVDTFQSMFHRLPRLEDINDQRQYEGILDEILDRIPPAGQPPEAPFMNEGWIRHELQKNLLEAAEQGDEGLAVIHPDNIRGRYTENPGLGKFYEVSVVPELKRLARRYGAEMGVSGKELNPVSSSWMSAVDSLNNLNVDDAMEDKELGRIARLALDAIEDSGYDIDNVPHRARDMIETFANDPVNQYDPEALSRAIAIARNTIQRDLSQKSFKTQVNNPTLKLTPELREKIKRIGVPLYSLPFLLGEDESEGYAEGGKVGALQKALGILAIDRRAKARNIQKPDVSDPVKTVQESMKDLPLEDQEAINSMLLSDDEDQVLDALLMLHGKFFPLKTTDDSTRFPIPPKAPPRVEPAVPPHGHGKISPEEWERIIMSGKKKAKGGKVRV